MSSLSKFKRETLEQFIFRHHSYTETVIDELEKIERAALIDRLLDENKKLLREMEKLHGVENYKKWLILSKYQSKIESQLTDLICSK